MFFYYIYEVLLLICSPFIICWHLYRSLKRGRPAAFAERFGFLPSDLRHSLSGHDVIWLHAVSVGETIAIKSLVKELREKFPLSKIVVSNVTETGRSIALRLPDVNLCIYFPFDFRFAVRKIIASIQPSIVVIAETEIWPNFLRETARKSIPIVLVNGRISDRSFGRYLKLSSFFRPVLENVSAFCMQSDEDARRIIAIGALPARVHVTGNLKYDIQVHIPDADEKQTLRDAYRINKEQIIITAGSTHAGEEETILSAYKQLLLSGHDCFLVLVPRHPERASNVAAIIGRYEMPFSLRSEVERRKEKLSRGEVLLVDSVGELIKLYTISDLVFVGGSLVPTGGHNILEPASLGVPVIFGPHMGNFRDSAALLLDHEAALQVNDVGELVAAMQSLLKDGERRRSMGRNGMKLIAEKSGATQRQIEIITKLRAA